MEAIVKIFSMARSFGSSMLLLWKGYQNRTLGRSSGPVQNVIMALPHTKSWSAIREELKRCFSDQISLGHTAAQLENMTQKPNEPFKTLHLLVL